MTTNPSKYRSVAFNLFLSLVTVAGLSFPTLAAADDNTKEQERVEESGHVIKDLSSSSNGIPTGLLHKSECVIVLPSVKKGGFIVTLVARIDQAELDKHGIRGASLSVEPTSNELAEIGKLIDQRKIKVIVSQTFPLSEAAKAQEQIATGHTRGKIVLKVADEQK